MMWRSPAAALLLIAGVMGTPQPVAAAEHPPYLPTRDVSVTYQIDSDKMQGGPGIHTVKIAYSAATGRARIEQADGPGYLIVDRTAGHALMVMEPMQTYMAMPFDPKTTSTLMLDEKMHFTRAGSDKAAGLACKRWDVASDKTTGRLCITDDGVILRGEGKDPAKGAGKMTATAVSYGALPASLFSPPAGFRRMEMPAGMKMAPPALRPPG
jgi:hypothetical protein